MPEAAYLAMKPFEISQEEQSQILCNHTRRKVIYRENKSTIDVACALCHKHLYDIDYEPRMSNWFRASNVIYFDD